MAGGESSRTARGAPARRPLVEPPRVPDLAPQRERPLELDTDDEPRPGAPSRLQYHAQDAVDAEPGVPEAGVGSDHRAATVRFLPTALVILSRSAHRPRNALRSRCDRGRPAAGPPRPLAPQAARLPCIP